jgi:hypothetical protein
MLILLSPAKSMNFEAGSPDLPATTPVLASDIADLSEVTRKLTARKIASLMDLSDKLASLNHARFQAFDPAMEDGLQAILAFNGDVYLGLKARELDRKALNWAQDHVRILSGLYGVLRPLDAIQAYRLEMGTGLKTPRGGSLYKFWGDRIARTLDADLAGQADPTIINCASQEYFGAVDLKALKAPVIQTRFLEEKDGQARILSFFAKKARGLMARFAIDNRIDRAADLKAFNSEGYVFQPAASTESEWVFSRPQPPPVGTKKG